MPACLAVVLFVTFGYGRLQTLFRSNNYIVALDSGATINFIKSDMTAYSLQLNTDVTSRELTQEEAEDLFGVLPVIGDIFVNDSNFALE